MNPVGIWNPKERKIQLELVAKGRFNDEEVKKYIKKSQKYPKAVWGTLLYPPCAVVGGGPGLDSCLGALRKWKGDIFAINDTAGYLSDQGIASYIYSIDAIDVPFRIGKLVKGALFATRVHPIQYRQFNKKPVQVFSMVEDDKSDGIEGGPTGVCRTPHLFLKMGYRAIVYFGIEGCFYNTTHMGGNRDDAFWNMMIIEVNGKQFMTNGGLLLQTQCMANYFKLYPNFLVNASGGFIEAMIKDPDGWDVKAVSGDLRNQYESAGCAVFSTPHAIEEDKLWRPPLAIASVQIS
jgi:hypothetical protein